MQINNIDAAGIDGRSIISHADGLTSGGNMHMPWWRRLLCIVVGTPIALSGAFLMTQGVPRVLIIGAFLLGVGGLLELSGVSPSARRDY